MFKVGLDVGGGEAVAQEVGVARVLVLDDGGDHDVADAAVEGRGLAHDVDAADLAAGLADAREVVVGGHAERVVDVDDEGVALAQELEAGDLHARVEAIGE
jgi:hypothetical protein